MSKESKLNHLEPAAGTFAFGTLLANYAGMLPDGATICALIYAVIKIYETDTFQKWKANHKRWYIAAFSAAGALLVYSVIRLFILAGKVAI